MAAVHHIGFNCKDRVAMENFYIKHFGFKKVRAINAGQDDEFSMLRLGSTCVELFTATGDPASHKPGEQPAGFKHFAMEVEDMEKTIAGLKADGIETDDIIDCGGMVPGLRVCFFDDPEGNRLEIMNGWQDE